MRSKLTELLFNYRKGESGYQEILDASILFVYTHLRPSFWFSQEDWHEFIAHIIPQIGRLIATFDDQGKDFEAYLSSCIRYRVLSFWNAKKKYHQLTLHSLEIPGDGGNYADETPRISWTVEESKTTNPVLNAKAAVLNETLGSLTPNSRRLVIYVLKNSVWTRDQFLILLGKRINLNPEWLIEKRAEVLDLMEPMWQERIRLSDLSSKFLEELHATHRALQNWKSLPPETIMLYQKKERFFRQKIARTSNRLEAQTLTPTHGDLARILGVPKGTVDSTMYYLRIYWHNIEPTIKDILSELSS